MFDIVTFGGATRDIFFKTAEGIIFPDPEDVEEKVLGFKYGQKIITDNAYFSFGGGAFNTAVSFAKLGLKTATCINLGKDESSASILNKLDLLNIDKSLISVDSENHTALSIIIMDKKDHVAFLHRGANNFLTLPNLQKAKEAKWFYILSLTGESGRVLPDIVRFAAETGIKVAINPGIGQLKAYKQLEEILPKVELLVLNREEAEELICSEESCEIIEDIKILLYKVLKMGVKRVVITEGAKGSYYGDNDTVNFEAAFKKDGITVDTTGAGDAFGSTFIANLIKGLDISVAQKMAAVNSASVTEKVGAQEGLLTVREIQAKLKEIKVVK